MASRAPCKFSPFATTITMQTETDQSKVMSYNGVKKQNKRPAHCKVYKVIHPSIDKNSSVQLNSIQFDSVEFKNTLLI